MIYTAEVKHMCPVAKGAYHGPAPIPEEGKWVQAKEIKDISGFTHGVGWCAPQQGACKLSLNIKEGVIEEALEVVYQDAAAQAVFAEVSFQVIDHAPQSEVHSPVFQAGGIVVDERGGVDRNNAVVT